MANNSRRNIQQFVLENVIDDGIITFQSRPHTIVEIWAMIPVSDNSEKLFRGIGHAELGKNDPWDEVLGYNIACGRAIKSIVKQLNKELNK